MRPTTRPLPDDVTRLYRYSSAERLDRLEPILLNHRIYVPTARELNDPREAAPRLADIPLQDIVAFLKRQFVENNPDLPKERYEVASSEIDWMAERSTAEHLLTKLAESLHNATRGTRILSMSKRWNNVAMWAKYADDHRGYCLEFSKTGFVSMAREVTYDDTLRLDIRDPTHSTFAWYFYKSPEWSNEEEVRVVLARMFGGPIFHIEPDCLTRVILGKDTRRDDELQIRDWTRRRVPELAVAKVEFDGYTQELRLHS